MRREIVIHLTTTLVLLAVAALFKGWFSLDLWPFWVGGLIGMALPDLDHLIYVYFLKPQELVSQRFNYMVGKREIWQSFAYLAETRSERSVLIFHTVVFQLIFLVLTLLVVTSSGSTFGRGLVLAAALHLSVDQFVDLWTLGNLDNWFKNAPFSLDRNKTNIYWLSLFLLVLFFAIFL